MNAPPRNAASRAVALDVDEYRALPLELRARMDEWLLAEDLYDKALTRIVLVEGGVIVDRYERDDQGHVLAVLGKPVKVTGEPVRTASWPPAECFTAGPLSSLREAP